MGEEQKEVVTEIPPAVAEADFRISLKLRRRIAGGVLLLDLDFGGDEATWYGPAASFGVSIPTFDNEEQAATWIDRVSDLFLDAIKTVTIDALRLLLTDAGSLASIEAGFSFFDVSGLIAGHMALAETLLRQRLGLAPLTTWPPWTAQGLSEAIFQAMCSVTNSNPTYELVARKLQAMFPGRPPTTGEALRKVVKQYGVDWMGLKRHAEKLKARAAKTE
jgi:hypothetical protein